MTGRPNPGRRAELLEQILDYLETHALNSISMRKLAQALGVSTFTLTYQFNSQEELMAAIRTAVNERLLTLGELLNSTPGSRFAYAESCRRFWNSASSKQYAAYLRLEMESSIQQSLEPEARIPALQARAAWRLASTAALVSLGVPPSAATVEAEVNQATVFGLLHAAISSPRVDFAAAFDYALAAHVERIAELAEPRARAGRVSSGLGRAAE